MVESERGRGELDRSIAIVGSAPSTVNLAPYEDESWEIWALAHRYYDLPEARDPRATRLYEVHNPKAYKATWQKLYQEFLRNPPCEIWTRPKYAKQLPACKLLPEDEMTELQGLGYPYYASSLAFMVMHAIQEGVKEIAIYGVDLAADGEYAHEKPNLEFCMAIAVQRGIKLHIPKQSALLSLPDGVYGETLGEESVIGKYVAARVDELGDEIDHNERKTLMLQGAKTALGKLGHVIRGAERGSDVTHWR